MMDEPVESSTSHSIQAPPTTLPAPVEHADTSEEIENVRDEMTRCRLGAYSNILQAFGTAMAGDVDQTRRLVEEANRLLTRAHQLVEEEEVANNEEGEQHVASYLSSMQAMAQAFLPLAEALDAGTLLDFELARSRRQEARRLLKRAAREFDVAILDSAFWKEMSIYLSKLTALLQENAAGEMALYGGDMASYAVRLRRAASLQDNLREYLPTSKPFEHLGNEGVALGNMLAGMWSFARDQMPRQVRILNQKARMVQQYAVLGTRPSWKMRILFFILWLVSIAVVAGIAKWTSAQVNSTALLWWSALSAGVATGLLELGEWLAFLRKKGLQEIMQRTAGDVENQDAVT